MFKTNTKHFSFAFIFSLEQVLLMLVELVMNCELYESHGVPTFWDYDL